VNVPVKRSTVDCLTTKSAGDETIAITLGLAGILIAVLGALTPATWAARTRVATALRTE
jgi:hypothetical protein